MRTRLTKISLAIGTTVLLALTACASDFNEESESQGADQSDVANGTRPQLYKPVAPHPANVCCVGESLTSGAYCGRTTNDYGGTWCCGWAKCTDKDICGEDYNEYLETCSDCTVVGCSNPHGYPQPLPENELKQTEAPAAESQSAQAMSNDEQFPDPSEERAECYEACLVFELYPWMVPWWSSQSASSWYTDCVVACDEETEKVPVPASPFSQPAKKTKG